MKSEPTTNEKRLLYYGIGLTLLLAAEVVVLWLLDREMGQGAAAAILAEVFSGREGGIPVAIAAGVPPLLVWQISLTQDIAAFLLTYPFFLWALHHYRDRDNVVMRQVQRIEAAARRRRRYVRRWGPLGVFLFMLVPFLVNGPIVGGVTGRIAGIPTRRLYLPIIAATALAAAAWTFFFEQTVGRVADVDPVLGYLIAGIIAATLLTAGLIGVARDEQRRALALQDDEE